jgi:hypothetical protein
MWQKNSRPNFSQYVSNSLEEPVEKHELFELREGVYGSRLSNPDILKMDSSQLRILFHILRVSIIF